MDNLARRFGMTRQMLIGCAAACVAAVFMVIAGVCFLVSGDFLYGAIMCGCGILVGFCVGLFRAKCLMDAELRSYDERGRELSRMACGWDYNGSDGDGEIVFFKKGLSCETSGKESVPFFAFSAMAYCGLDGDGAMVVLKDKKGILVFGSGNLPRAKGVLSRLEANGVAVKVM